MDDPSKNQLRAGLEFLDWNVNPEAPLNGALQCFCDNEAKTLGPQKWIAEFKYKASYAIKDIENADQNEKICRKYQETRWKILVMDNMIKYFIIILNTVIRMVVIIIINKVGCSTESTQMKYITDCVFICIFFNTGFLLMLCNSNLTEQSYLWGALFKGNDSDFNQNWFTSMGDTIVGSMKFNVWFPVVMEIMNWGMRAAFRYKDYYSAEEAN